MPGGVRLAQGDVHGRRALSPDPADLDAASALGLLAEHDRLRVVAAVVLGAATAEEIVERSGIEPVAARRALDRLVNRGVLGRVGDRYEVQEDLLRRIASASAPPRPKAHTDLPAAQRRVLQAFMPDGVRLTGMPASKAKRLTVLDHLSGRFDPGKTYPEAAVNAMLSEAHDDYAALRRALVDEGFLERRDGFYWRAGGTFEVDEG